MSEPEQQYFVVDIRPEFSRQKYITFWRPNNANYAWPLSWAGRYDKSTVDAEGDYYYTVDGGKALARFPVPCEVVEAMGLTDPDDRDIDGNAGPVLRNTAAVRRKLRAAAYIPVGVVAGAVGD